ncbi:hypothetical protein BLA29_013383, partial [Euroglyphus maynei]
MNRKIDNNY